VKKIQNDFEIKTKKIGNHLLKRVDKKKKTMKYDFPTKSRFSNKASSSGARSLATSGTNVYLTVDAASESCDNEPMYSYGMYLGSTECIKYDGEFDDFDYDIYDTKDTANHGSTIKKRIAAQQKNVHRQLHSKAETSNLGSKKEYSHKKNLDVNSKESDKKANNIDNDNDDVDDIYEDDDLFPDNMYYTMECIHDTTTDSYALKYVGYVDSIDCSGDPTYSIDIPLNPCVISDDCHDDDSYYGNSTQYEDDDEDDDDVIEYLTQKCVTSNTPWNDGKEGILTTEYEDDVTCTTDQIDATFYYKYYIDVCMPFSDTESVMYTSCADNAYGYSYFATSGTCEGTAVDGSRRLQGCSIEYEDDVYEYEYEYEDDDYYNDGSTSYNYNPDDAYYVDDDDDDYSMQFCSDDMPTEASAASTTSDTLSSGATAGIAVASVVVAGGVLVGAGFAVQKVMAAKAAASMASVPLKSAAATSQL